MPVQILLTGPPGCGKTTLVSHIVEQLGDLRLAGFITKERRGPDGRRVGFQAIGLHGKSVMLASVSFVAKTRVAKYGVELSGFEELIRCELQRPSEEVDLFIVDEVGKMECFSQFFVAQMQLLLDGPTPLLLTVAMKGSGFIATLKQQASVELIEVTRRNRDELADKLAERLHGLIAG